MNKVIWGDCLPALKKLEPDSVDLVVTDPPYGYSFMGKDWDKAVPSVDIWKECLRVLKPGAFAFIMSAPRQDVLSQMIVRIGEAGFDTDFTSIYWTYSSGFPKSGNLHKMLVKRLGVSALCACAPRSISANEYDNEPNGSHVVQGSQSGYPSSPHSDGALPLSGQDNDRDASPSLNGAQARTRSLLHEDGQPPEHANSLLIDNGHPSNQGYSPLAQSASDAASYKAASIKVSADAATLINSDKPLSHKQRTTLLSSFPNCTMCGKPNANGAYLGFQPKPAVEICIVAMKPLSEKTFVDQALKNGKGVTWLDDCHIPSNRTDTRHGGGDAKVYGKYGDEKGYDLPSGRFPANLLVSDDVLNDGVERHKHGGGDRANKAPQPYSQVPPTLNGKGGLPDSGSYSRYFDLDSWWDNLIEKLPKEQRKVFPFAIIPKASKREKNGSKHPTIKPVKLMSYLITLGSREGDIVLDCFGGSGSTAIAAKMLNRRCIIIEREAEYVDDINRRLKAVPNTLFAAE